MHITGFQSSFIHKIDGGPGVACRTGQSWPTPDLEQALLTVTPPPALLSLLWLFFCLSAMLDCELESWLYVF